MSEDDEKLIAKFDGKDIPMNPFIKRIIRKTVLAMLSTLKGVEIQGEETIEINVKRAA